MGTNLDRISSSRCRSLLAQLACLLWVSVAFAEEGARPPSDTPDTAVRWACSYRMMRDESGIVCDSSDLSMESQIFPLFGPPTDLAMAQQLVQSVLCGGHPNCTAIYLTGLGLPRFANRSARESGPSASR